MEESQTLKQIERKKDTAPNYVAQINSVNGMARLHQFVLPYLLLKIESVDL